MSRKGVSPLFAAVMLIAFVLGVAAILTAWVTTFTQEQTQQLENQSSEQIDCTFGQLEIFSTSSSDGENTSWVSVAVTNEGRVGFNNTSIVALESDGSVVGRGYLSDFEAGETRSQNISWGNSDATVDASGGSTVRVGTASCPTVTVESDIG